LLLSGRAHMYTHIHIIANTHLDLVTPMLSDDLISFWRLPNKEQKL